MSLNQSRSDKNDSHYKKSGVGRSSNSGQQRNFSGGSGKGSTGGGNGAPPLASHSSSASSNRSSSFKKASNNAQGGHSRPNVGSVNSSDSNSAAAAARGLQNGTHVQPPVHGPSDAPAPPASSKQADLSTQKSNRPLPRAPSSQASTVTPDPVGPATPAKASGDAGKGFPLQFGSISPGFMNGMQIPARTSSAPPNLDEQKRDQARHESSRTVPAAVPVPSASKSQMLKKDVAPAGQTGVESGTDSKPKKDTQVAPSLPQTQPQKPPVLPTAGISMPVHFHQPQVAIPFGGPNPQIQSQGMQGTSLQMPMQVPIQMGNASQVPQQVFVPGLTHPLMQPQGVMHQGQSLGFNPQMGPQMPHQLGNLGMNIQPQFSQQQAGKFASTRKAVKITHPETHEELRLDKRTDVYTEGGSSGSRSHNSLPPHSQPLPSYTPAHPIGYYPNSYSSAPSFFPSPNSLPLNTPLTSSSQTPRFNYSVGQAPPNISFINPSAPNSFPLNKSHGAGEVVNLDHPRDHQGIISSVHSSTPVTIKPATLSVGERTIDSSSSAEKSDSPRLLRLPGSSNIRKDAEMSSENSSIQAKASVQKSKESTVSVSLESLPAGGHSLQLAAPGEPASAVNSVDIRQGGTVTRSESIKENQKKSGKKAHCQPSDQVGLQSNSSWPYLAGSSGDSSAPIEAKRDHSESRVCEAAPASVSGAVADACLQNAASDPPDIHGDERIVSLATEDDAPAVGAPQKEMLGLREQGGEHSGLEAGNDNLETVPPLNKVEVEELVGRIAQDPATCVTEICQGMGSAPPCGEVEEIHVEVPTSSRVLSSADDRANTHEYATKCSMSDGEMGSIPGTSSEASSNIEEDVMESSRPTSSSGSVYGGTKASLEPQKTKSTVSRGKKKKKEILQKADAAGTTSDLYMAYKCPEEKKEMTLAAQTTERSSDADQKVSVEADHEDALTKAMEEPTKAEIDDWEDAADISTPKLDSSITMGHGGEAKKYSRDFLLTFSELCTDLPDAFEITSDIADVLIRPNVNASRITDREYSGSARIVDRQSGVNRVDRRVGGMMDGGERWNKMPGSFPPGRDMGPDLNYGANMMGFRPGQGNSYGVLRNPRGQAPVQYAGGILSGPMQSLGGQGAMQRNNSDSDRWQRGTNFQKGLMPPPQTPLQVMHKADRKYEVGKITDEEEAKQRRLKAILNKLTPQNFQKLFEQVKEVNIDNDVTLTGVISQIFDKALMEPTFCEMYANFCSHLAADLPDLSVDNEKITFKRLLLNKCQEEFERGEREEEEANKADGEGESKQTEEEREEKRLKARRRMLGNIRLIGELYKKRMLTERIMHECIKKLLGQFQTPDEENIEALCKLMSTIGEMIDHPKAKEHMDFYFEMLAKLSNNMKLSSRVRFMLKDVIDLRKNRWQQRRKVEGPKKIDEVHRDAAQERQAQTSRLSRGPGMNSSMRRGQPIDFVPRASSVMPSPVSQMSSFRPLAPPARGYQDARVEERPTFDNRTISVPLPQRPLGDDSITLGPQGGLARGMSVRGHPSVSNMPLPDIASGHNEVRRTVGLNGYSSVSERAAYSSREEPLSRYPPERLPGTHVYNHSNNADLGQGYNSWDQRNPDRGHEKPNPSQPLRVQGVAPVPDVSLEKVWPEERLREMSISTIKEFYSAKDEKEVVHCIKDMNAPSFYPSMISNWVNDSFERKDMERDMLAKLLVNLSSPGDGVFSHVQLVEGFEAVLSSLEDTVNDAPRAAEFLGRILGKAILENVVSLGEVGKLILEGGEEPGLLREAGLSGDVLGSILEMIKSDGGDSTLKDILSCSKLRLEDFRPPDPLRSKKLEMFI